jgi:hypothetical protein
MAYNRDDRVRPPYHITFHEVYMRESTYQTKLIKKLEFFFPGCVILKNDPTYIQGIPDLLILFNDRWAALEVKISEQAAVQPNQLYWIDYLMNMSYAAFICPNSEERVLHELQHALGTSW